MPRIYIYEGTRSTIMWVPNLEDVSLELMRLGRHAEAMKRRKTYEVKDAEGWTIRASSEIIEVSLTMSGDLW
jgi:hypothetical protein